MTTTTTALQAPMFRGDKLEVVTIGALVGFLAASQLSVALYRAVAEVLIFILRASGKIK